MMLQLGVGMFYDVGYGATAGAFNGAPFTNVRTISEVTFPLAANLLIAPPMPPIRPYGLINSADPSLVAPRVYQWNATWEHNYGINNTLTVGLIGNAGRDLALTQTQPSYTSAYNLAILTTNGAESDYNALQLQFRRRMSTRLQMQLSYTWSHTIDSTNGSGGPGGGGFGSILTGQRADADYDIRQNFTWAGSYQLPGVKNRIGGALLRNWFLDFNFFARTGLPFDVQGVSNCTSDAGTSNTCPTTNNTGLFALVRPSLTGAAIWISDSSAPGGRRLNPAAFALPTGYQQGSLGRNTLRGFGANQLDLSFRRVVPLTERVRLNLSIQAFNVFNHPNFANPSQQEGGSMASPEFGLVTRMLNTGFGGASALYQSGGPRSMELSVRLQF